MHDSKKATVDLSREEIELLVVLVANKFAETTDVKQIAMVSGLYNKLERAKVGL